ncbi:MAG: nucleotidyltransferase family protein [Sphingomonadales bacterium]
MARPLAALWAVIRRPAGAAEMSAADWNRLIRLARREFVLGRLAEALANDAATWPRLPEKVRAIMAGARREVAFRQTRLMWEVDRLAYALRGLDAPVVLLKGAAYLGAGLTAGRGRIAADLDILTDRRHLQLVEDALRAHGFAPEPHDEYDEQYYRAWMHELPPLRHQARGTVIDVHHAILPLTARPRPDTGLLLAASVACGETGFRRLGDHDLFIHSAVHLFHDGEFINGLRNLIELHDLMVEFGKKPEFFEGLMDRARGLGLGRYAAYGLRQAHGLLAAPVPAAVLAAAKADLPSPPLLWLMDGLFSRALMGVDLPRGRPRAMLSQRLLYIRSHWLRMPPVMLARHLARKSLKRWTGKAPPAPPAVAKNDQ